MTDQRYDELAQAITRAERLYKDRCAEAMAGWSAAMDSHQRKDAPIWQQSRALSARAWDAREVLEQAWFDEEAYASFQAFPEVVAVWPKS